MTADRFSTTVERIDVLLSQLVIHLPPGELDGATELFIRVRQGAAAYIKHGRTMYVSLGAEGVEKYEHVAQGVGRLQTFLDGRLTSEYPRRALFNDTSLREGR